MCSGRCGVEVFAKEGGKEEVEEGLEERVGGGRGIEKGRRIGERN